jgi:hypothetical protein
VAELSDYFIAKLSRNRVIAVHLLPGALLSVPPAIAGGFVRIQPANPERILKILIRPSAEAIN